MDPFIGQIMMFGGTFAPRGWAKCDGQLLDISSHSALFSILGTTYGGDGRTNFALPDLRGRVPMNWGHGPGLANRVVGQKGGAETVTLTTQMMPSHSHNVIVTSATGNTNSPVGKVLAAAVVDDSKETKADDYGDFPSPANDTLDTRVITNTGGGGSHNNVQPFQCLTYVIALVGIYPSRN